MPRYSPHKKQNALTRKIITLGLFFLLLLIVWGIKKSFDKNISIDTKTGQLSMEIEKLEKENQELTDLIAYFSTPEFVDKEAREKLNLLKPGEKVIIIPQEDNNANQNNINNQQLNNWRLWLKYFFE